MSTQQLGELRPRGGQPIPLLRPYVAIGRFKGCDILLPATETTGAQCELVWQEGRWFVRDLNNSNGVKVKGVRVQSQALAPGDEFAVGSCAFTLHYTTSPAKSAEFDESDLLEALAQTSIPIAAPPPPPQPTRAPVPTAPSCRLELGGATSPGRVRDRNEDSFLIQHLAWSNRDQRHEFALVVLADGLGGHEAGDIASGLVVRTVGVALAPLLACAVGSQPGNASVAGLTESIKRALREANQAVLTQAASNPAYKGMGATAAVLLIWNGRVVIGHVGDCRVYHFTRARLTQITRDQTLVARMVELGTLTPEQARTHPSRNEVSSAVGKNPTIEPAAYQLELAPGEGLIIASDGLHAHLDGAPLKDAIGEASSSATGLAHWLVELANKGGGSDNVTVVAVRRY